MGLAWGSQASRAPTLQLNEPRGTEMGLNDRHLYLVASFVRKSLLIPSSWLPGVRVGLG